MTQEERTRISRELIIQGAIREFSRHGYEDASINRLCTDNGISKGRLFHHFQNKDEIFLETVRACLEGLADHTKNFHPDSEQSLESNFHGYFKHRQQYFVTNPYLALLLASSCVQRPLDEFREHIWRLREHYEKYNLEKLREILSNSLQTVSSVDSDLLLQAFHVASYFIHLHVGSPNWDPEKDMEPVAEHSLEVFDKVVHMLLYGVLPHRDNKVPSETGAVIYRYLADESQRQKESFTERSEDLL